MCVGVCKFSEVAPLKSFLEIQVLPIPFKDCKPLIQILKREEVKRRFDLSKSSKIKKLDLKCFEQIFDSMELRKNDSFFIFRDIV